VDGVSVWVQERFGDETRRRRYLAAAELSPVACKWNYAGDGTKEWTLRQVERRNAENGSR
jgi:hypothetical protein